MLLLLTGYILHSSLKKKDQDLLQTKFQEYSSLLESQGIAGLQLRISGQKIPDARRFLVRYQSASGQTLFLHVPESMEVVGKTMTLQKLDSELKNQTGSEQWLEIKGNDYGDDVEVLSVKLPQNDYLQIGKDTEDREDFLEEFVRSYVIGLLPVMGLAILLGFFLSKRMLSPIRWLTNTVQNIRSGHSDDRVPLSGNRDELDQLGLLFNQMQDQNEALVRGIKETLDHVAHDLRTPVMRMQNAAHSALQGGDREEALLECQENSETILKMLNAIMDISEVETGTMALKRESLDLAGLLENVLDIYGFIAEEKNIKIDNTVEPLTLIMGDKGRLLQMLANLIDNAIKFSPADSRIEIKASKTNDHVVVEIIDEGPGIPEADRLRIWDRLYRGDQSRSTRGLGLGLSFVAAIIKAHGASITVENNATKGSTFRISFLSA